MLKISLKFRNFQKYKISGWISNVWYHTYKYEFLTMCRVLYVLSWNTPHVADSMTRVGATHLHDAHPNKLQHQEQFHQRGPSTTSMQWVRFLELGEHFALCFDVTLATLRMDKNVLEPLAWCLWARQRVILIVCWQELFAPGICFHVNQSTTYWNLESSPACQQRTAE